jgi:hypothetical protein
MMLDQEVRAVAAVGSRGPVQIQAVLVTLQRHLLTVETAHLQHLDKEIMEEVLVPHQQPRQVAEVDLAV